MSDEKPLTPGRAAFNAWAASSGPREGHAWRHWYQLRPIQQAAWEDKIARAAIDAAAPRLADALRGRDILVIAGNGTELRQLARPDDLAIQLLAAIGILARTGPEVVTGVSDEPRACDVDVWDGPYRMNCGYRLVNGKCIRHGESTMRRWRAARKAASPDPPSDAMTPGQAAYERHQQIQRQQFSGIMPIGWHELSDAARAGWDAIAQDAVDAHESTFRGRLEALAADLDARSEHAGGFAYAEALGFCAGKIRDALEGEQ